MLLLSLINPLYSASGLAVGILVGLTGVGGGSLMTPVLVLVFGIHAATAVGTDLLYAAITKTAGTMVHGANRTVDWRIVVRLAAGSVPATALTLLTVHYFAPESSNSKLISMILGIALMATAVSLLFRKYVLDAASRRVGDIGPRRELVLTVIVGVVLGILVSLSSVGAGALGITALIFLYPKVPLVTIVGSDIAHAVPLTLVAGIGHWLLGSVDGALLLSLVVGSLPGIIIGSYLAPRVPERVLRPILAATLLLVGCKLVF